MKRYGIVILYLLFVLISPLYAQSGLFDAYPNLKSHVPYLALGSLDATPIVVARAIGQPWGTKLYVKCDGVYGIDKSGKKIFTGNKRRKLEFLLADALAHGAKRIYALGGAGSNFATATAAYARELGLACTLVLGPQRNTRYVQRNLKLDLFYGADIVACPTREARTQTCNALAQNDPFGYFVPLGGSNKVGAFGFVNAAFELKKQIDANIVPKPDVIYITISSAGMAAGLIVGLKAAGLDIPVRPVRIDDTPEETEGELARLIQETSDTLHGYDQTFPLVHLAADQLQMINDMAGEPYIHADYAGIKRHRDMHFDAYALITPEDARAVQMLYTYTGIKLDQDFDLTLKT
jgi:D-cysteine desulfhydrase